MTKHREKRIFLLSIFLIIVMLCGCDDRTIENRGQEKNKEKREVTDVSDKKWISPSTEPRSMDGWEVVEYMPDIVKLSDENLIGNDAFISSNPENFFALIRYEKNVGDNISYGYEWKVIDLRTMEQYVKVELFASRNLEGVLAPEMAEEISKMISQGYARVTSFEACGSTINIFLTVWNQSWEIRHFYLLRMSQEGDIEWANDYVDIVWPDINDRLGQFDMPDAYYGKDGIIYCIDQISRTIKIFNEKGDNLKTFDLVGMGRAPIQYAGKTQEDIPIFYAELMRDGKEFFRVDEDGIHEIWKGTLNASRFRLDQYGYMLLLQGDKLMTWNVLSGESQCLYQFTGLDAFTCEELTRNADGEIVLFYGLKGENGFIYRLNDSEHSDMLELTLLQDVQDAYTAKCAANYTRTHPGIRIKTEQIDTNDEMTWQRLVSTISSGQGPDMILADRERLSILRNAGVICSITDRISEGDKSKIFTGAMKYGMFENEIYAMPCNATVGIWMIRKDLIPEGRWDLDGIMDTFGNWKNQNPNVRRVICLSSNTTSEQLLYHLCLLNLEYCEFIDFENHKCNFETETFYRLLKFCLENGENQEISLPREERWRQMLEGEAFLYWAGGSLSTYSANRKALGDQFCVIGYPSGNKTTSMIYCSRAVAISEKSKNKDVAIDFLLSLISEENQVNYTTEWVSRDVMKEHVKNQSEGKDGPYFQITRYNSMPLDGRDDGTSYLDEYIQLMDQGEPWSFHYRVRDMVMEEAMAYFAGDKTAEEAAKIIQKRVQNYLNEQ